MKLAGLTVIAYIFAMVGVAGAQTLNCKVGVPCNLSIMVAPADTPTASPTSSPSPSPTSTSTPQPSPSPSPTVAPTATPTLAPTPSPSPSAVPTPAPAPVHFNTLPPNAALPSGAQCAAWANAIPMPEVVQANAPFNSSSVIPGASNLATFHANPQPFKGDSQGVPGDWLNADGNYSGTTDQIIRWSACKWGIDEDIVRAQAQNESSGWLQSGHGDRKTAQASCSQSSYPQLQIWNTTIALPDGNSVTCASCCYQSWGITQNKLYYEPTAAMFAINSTAFTLDLTYSTWRSCMNGHYATYFASQGGNTYAQDVTSGNVSRLLWGCVGTHFSGGWYDSGANTYISQVQTILNNRSWP